MTDIPFLVRFLHQIKVDYANAEAELTRAVAMHASLQAKIAQETDKVSAAHANASEIAELRYQTAREIFEISLKGKCDNVSECASDMSEKFAAVKLLESEYTAKWSAVTTRFLEQLANAEHALERAKLNVERTRARYDMYTKEYDESLFFIGRTQAGIKPLVPQASQVPPVPQGGTDHHHHRRSKRKSDEEELPTPPPKERSSLNSSNDVAVHLDEMADALK